MDKLGDELDIMAPGTYIPTTDPTINGWVSEDYYFDFLGTSAAAPHVSAVAGLILSVNPNLTNLQVNDIIESTAQKVNENTLYSYQNHTNRPNGTWNNEMGYGLVDAHAAVVLAQSMNTNTVDLYTKDTPLDFGIEPNTNPNSTFLSQDIWVRHQPDGLTNFTHQTPYSFTDNYVYVSVRNKGSVTSSGNDQLHLYWSSWGTIWPHHWIDHYGPAFSNEIPDLFGDEVGSIIIPSLAPGEDTILEFPMGFYPVYPGLYGSYYKLLTRIVSTEDPIQNETSNVFDNILNNNNIASKNVWVSNDNEPYYRTVGTVYNPTDSTKTYSLEFSVDEDEFGKAIYNESEIHIDLEPELYNAWNDGGKQGNNFKTTNEDNVVIATQNNMTLSNIALQPNQLYSLNATFHFLTKELTDKQQFNYVVKQFDAENGELVDIVPIKIQKESRPIFLANAGDDLETDKNETITISAEQINEAAIYNWYDPDGNLIYQGKDLTVSADVTQKFKLEIVADSDGFKDYDEVDVTVNQFYLKTMVPNPATDNVVVNYKTIDVSSAYLMVIGTNSNTSNNYIIDTNLEESTIDISSYPIGYYTVALVCNGTIVDAKTLIKN
ncbi:S8 family serine peptidase [uncultured Xanthomarina sp.]|uniref:S8 family serine peptidase n=1 Tax=uncultured Xanthomarina sp. TaxID=1868331 RepID=UPI0030DB49C1